MREELSGFGWKPGRLLTVISDGELALPTLVRNATGATAPEELRLSRRPQRIRGGHRKLVIGERAAAAIRVQTSPSTDTEIDPNRLALSGKILDLLTPPNMSLP